MFPDLRKTARFVSLIFQNERWRNLLYAQKTKLKISLKGTVKWHGAPREWYQSIDL
jgi:hypothetical protein